MKREIKIGIFLGITLIILAGFIFLVGDLGTLFKKPGYPLYLYFDSAAGLEKHTVVRMAGVKIGRVKEISLKGSQAEVVLDIAQEVSLRKGSQASLAALGLLGEKYIEIIPGAQEGFYGPGDTLVVNPQIGLDQLGTELVTIGNEIKETGKLLRDLIGDEQTQGNLSALFQNLADFSADLKEFSQTNKQTLSAGISDARRAIQNFDVRLQDVTQDLGELIDLIKGMVEENSDLLGANLDNFNSLIHKAEDSLEQLDKSVQAASSGEGTLGKLIQQPELYNDAEKAVGEIKKFVAPVSALRATAGMHFEYFTRSDLLKSYLTLNLWPSPARFLMLGVTQDPLLDKFTFSVQGGIRWGGLVPRAGIIQSQI